MRSPWPAVLIAASFAFFATPQKVLGASPDFVVKVMNPNWLKETFITTGFVTSICAYQALNGITEGYHFSQETKHIATEDNYHVFKTARDLAGISTGLFTYAQFVDSRKSFLSRTSKVLGGALLASRFFEWSYKGQRYGNPFDYTPEHNRHAIVYFGVRNGAIVDLYIGTGNVTGPLVDIAVTALGVFLIR